MTGCTIAGCDRPHYARSWCKLHYRRWHDHGDPTWEPQGLSCDPIKRAAQLANLRSPEKREVPRNVAGTCVDCGGPCREGRLRCRPCWLRSGDRSGGRKPVWTRESIIATIQTWSARHDGASPRRIDVPNSDLPTDTTVKKFFATYGDAIAAAGLERRVPGETLPRGTTSGKHLYRENRQMVTGGAVPGARAGRLNVREVVNVRRRRNGQAIST
jgi:hypothetical protein